MNKKYIFDIETARSLVKYGYYSCLINANIGKFSKRSMIYPFTTENLTGYFEQLDFNNKKVLSVAGSGDHVFNSILYGAKDVTMFDINRFTKYYIELKKAAISALSYEKFLSFATLEGKQNFSLNIYEQIRDRMNDEIKLFWDTLYQQFTGERIRKTLFRDVDNENVSILKKFNPYMNEKYYYKLQEEIDQFNINFIESNVTSLKKKLDDIKYDLILLSNISDYINRMYSCRCLQLYKNLILNLSNNLNQDGCIAVAYIYRFFGKTHHSLFNLFNVEEDRDEVFDKANFQTLYFDSVMGYGEMDAVMTYTKK